MLKARYILINRALIRWFLNVFLVLSVIAFSGSAGTTESQRQAAAQTEVKVSIHKQDNRTVSYHSFASSEATIFAVEQFTAALVVHDNLVTVKLTSRSNATHHKSVKVSGILYSPRCSIEQATNARG